MTGTVQTVLVTGAARRIGRAIAFDLARHGWRVALHCHRSREEAEALAAGIEAAGGRAAVFAADLGAEDETAALVPRVVDAMGPLGALVNNASVFENDSPETASRDSWDRHMQVNLRAPFVLSQSFAAQKSPGCIVNIADQRVVNPTPFFTSYTISKSALWAMTRSLALALAPDIRVNAIGPGPVLPSARQSEEQFARQWAALPLGRATRPEEIAAAVRFILDAPSMTGQMIMLDGGQHLGWAHCPGHTPPEE